MLIASLKDQFLQAGVRAGVDDLQFGLSACDLLDRADNVAKEGLAERAALVKTVAPERLADDAVVEDEVDERLAVLSMM